MKILTVCLNPTFQATLRFSSFSLGEVNRAGEHYLDASGKGMNAARIISQLGEESLLLTHLGGIRTKEMLQLCSRDTVQLLWADSHSEMRTCTTILFGGVTTELVQEPYPVDPSVEAPIRALFNKTIKDVDALILCGTRCPGYSDMLFAQFVQKAKELNKFVLLDLKGEDLKRCLPFRPDVIKPNLSEAVQTFLGKQIGEQEDATGLQAELRPILEDLYTTYNTTTVLSRGKRDLWVQAESFFTVPVQPALAVNTIGCGDALSAALTVQLCKKTNLQQALDYATNIATVQAKTIRPGSIV